MRLNPSAFNRHLAHIGQEVSWRPSFACSCRNPTSGAADTRCPHCGGKGQIWSPPTSTVCGVAGQKTQDSWAQSGRWVQGDIVVTIPGDSPMWEIGEFDRVQMMNAAERFSQALVRGAPTERLSHRVKSISRVFWQNKERSIVEGDIPDFDAVGNLTWGTGAPPPGTSYSITGQRFAEYYCFLDMVSSRNEHSGARLPKKVVLRRFDLLGRQGPN